jgi:hypothetical protein
MKAEMGLEFFRQKLAKQDDHVYHIVDITEEAEKRSKNDGPKPKTRFQIELDSAEFYRQWNSEKDRIVKRCGNKAIALDLMHRAWRDALSNSELDKILAAMEGPPL